MKKIFKVNWLFISILFFLLFLNVKGYSQLLNDQVSIVQKCVDLPNINQYLIKNADGSYKELHIMNFPFPFEDGIGAMKFSIPIVFNSRSEIQNVNPDMFWSFKKFLITSTGASVIFEINYNRLSSTPKFLFVSVDLNKTKGNWNILNSTINNKPL